MEFNAEKALLQANPNCRHCLGRGSVLRSHPGARNSLGQILHWWDYCVCVLRGPKKPFNVREKIEVFSLGKKNG